MNNCICFRYPKCIIAWQNIYICVCVCVYIYICVCIYIYICVCVCVSKYWEMKPMKSCTTYMQLCPMPWRTHEDPVFSRWFCITGQKVRFAVVAAQDVWCRRTGTITPGKHQILVPFAKQFAEDNLILFPTLLFTIFLDDYLCKKSMMPPWEYLSIFICW